MAGATRGTARGDRAARNLAGSRRRRAPDAAVAAGHRRNRRRCSRSPSSPTPADTTTSSSTRRRPDTCCACSGCRRFSKGWRGVRPHAGEAPDHGRGPARRLDADAADALLQEHRRAGPPAGRRCFATGAVCGRLGHAPRANGHRGDERRLRALNEQRITVDRVIVNRMTPAAANAVQVVRRTEESRTRGVPRGSSGESLGAVAPARSTVPAVGKGAARVCHCAHLVA